MLETGLALRRRRGPEVLRSAGGDRRLLSNVGFFGLSGERFVLFGFVALPTAMGGEGGGRTYLLPWYLFKVRDVVTRLCTTVHRTI